MNYLYFAGKAGAGSKSKNPRSDTRTEEPPLKTQRSVSASPVASSSRSTSEEQFRIPKVVKNPFVSTEPSSKKGTIQ